MKKCFRQMISCILVVTVLMVCSMAGLTVSAAEGGTENLIENGDLENGRPTWIKESVSDRYVQGEGKDGTYGYKVTLTTDAVDVVDDGKGKGSPMKPWMKLLQPNTTYTLSFDYKHEGAGHGNLWISRNIGIIHDAIGDTVAAGHEWVGQADLPLPGGDTDWQKIVIHFTTGDKISAQDDGLFWQQRNEKGEVGTGTTYYDNLVLAKAPPKSLLQNSDFEGKVDTSGNTWVKPETILDGVGVDGSRGIKVEGANESYQRKTSAYKNVLHQLDPAGIYKLTFDYKLEGKGYGQVYFINDYGTLTRTSVEGFEAGASLETQKIHFLDMGEVDWTPIEIVFTTPASISPNPANLSFEFVTDPAGAGAAYFDNIVLTKIGSAAATAIELNFTQVTLKKGETLKLNASASPEGRVMGKLSWSSGDKGIVGVSDEGEITALSGGVAIISVKAGSLTAFCKVTVEDDGGNNTVTVIAIAAAVVVIAAVVIWLILRKKKAVK